MGVGDARLMRFSVAWCVVSLCMHGASGWRIECWEDVGWDMCIWQIIQAGVVMWFWDATQATWYCDTAASLCSLGSITLLSAISAALSGTCPGLGIWL